MKLNHYLKFEKANKSFHRTRFDLIERTEPVYKMLDYNFIYLLETPSQIRSKQNRKSNLSIATKDGFLSSVFIPDPTNPNLALADIKDTEDLLLIIISEGTIEIFIAENQKNKIPPVFYLFADKELDEEINLLKAKSNPFNDVA